MVSRRRWVSRRALSVLAVAVAALLMRLPSDARLDEHLPARPAHLAHLLADFTHRHVGGAWTLEEEASNYTTWRYSVVYSCGARCSGRVDIEAHDEPGAAPAHGEAARAHTVHVRDTRCVRLPLVPWPQLCEQTERVARVSAEGSGSLVSERGSSWCVLWRAVTGECARDLRAQLEDSMQRLRAVLVNN